MSDVPNTAVHYLVGRSDLERFFFRDKDDAEAIMRAEAGDSPGEVVHIYEVRRIGSMVATRMVEGDGT